MVHSWRFTCGKKKSPSNLLFSIFSPPIRYRKHTETNMMMLQRIHIWSNEIGAVNLLFSISFPPSFVRKDSASFPYKHVASQMWILYLTIGASSTGLSELEICKKKKIYN